ncbi:MAG: hypothetical protein C0396_02075 [Anaerolinea sp.]|nr:hypothetical protein [Anaerolinea sp.]
MSDHISSLQARILMMLLDQHEPLSASLLADRLGSTASTIRYNLAYLKELVRKYGGVLSARPKVGYSLEITPEATQILREKLKSKEFQFQYDNSDRAALILFELLSSSEPQTLCGLTAKISASKVTLGQDLDKAEKWLQEHYLVLNRQTRTGTRIVGEEINLRQALVGLLLETISEHDLLNLCRWGMIHLNTAQNYNEQFQDYIISHIASWGLSDAWWLVNRILDQLAFRLSDKRYLFLVLYWAVMVRRFQQGHTVNLPGTILAALQESNEYKAVLTGADELARTRGLRISQTELAHFAAEIQTSPREAYNKLGDISDDSQDRKAVAIAQHFVENIASQTSFRLIDPVIFSRLCKHVGRTLRRIGYNLPIENPLTEEVKKNYPEMSQAVYEAAKNIQEDAEQFSQEEIAYIAMYFILAQELEKKSRPRKVNRVIVACPTGGISIWMLVSRLQKEFPDVEIVAAISLRELSQYDRLQADLIITTAHRVVDKQLPVITVSPFLTEQDIKILQSHLAN